MTQSQHEFRITICLLLALVTGAVYFQVGTFDFLNYDDEMFVFGNPHVSNGLSLGNIKWAFTTLNGNASYWHPLTWLSLQLDCQLFGLRPQFIHITNLCLHIANTVILFVLLQTMSGTIWRGVVVAALFALHPLHIESVAWISERKTLLCTFFWLLATFEYVKYSRCHTIIGYLKVAFLFVASLMSKPFAVTLPFTFVLLDYWPLDRLGTQPHCQSTSEQFPCFCQRLRNVKECIAEKIPFFMLAAATSLATFIAQRNLGALATLESVPLAVRMKNATVAYCLYLRKMIVPCDLAPIYPLRGDWQWWQVAGCGTVICCVMLYTLQRALTRPYLLVGWFWYLGTLVPVIGLIQAGSQGMADRYTYISLIGIFICLVWGFDEIATTLPKTAFVIYAGTAVLIILCGVSTEVQLKYWKNSIRLFGHAVESTEANHLAYLNLGQAFQGMGNIPESEKNLREAIIIRQSLTPAHASLGGDFFKKGDMKPAVKFFRRRAQMSQCSVRLGHRRQG